jgi:hypothetical protein
MKTIDIKGNDYVPVNERIKEFWRLYPNGRINTALLSVEDGRCIFRAEVYKDRESEKPDATGFAYELEGSTFINKTSFIENAETSGIGRALGILGIGIDASVASAEEVENAMVNQKKIDDIKVKALEKAISNSNMSNDKVTEVLSKFNYKSISDILVVDYMKVCNAFKEVK